MNPISTKSDFEHAWPPAQCIIYELLVFHAQKREQILNGGVHFDTLTQLRRYENLVSWKSAVVEYVLMNMANIDIEDILSLQQFAKMATV